MQHPDCMIDMTNAGKPSKSREVFDAKCSKNVEVADAMDPYKNLAVFYNSGPDIFSVKNLACEYDGDGKKTNTMADPYFSYGGKHTLLSFDGIFERVKDLDPSDYIHRDGDWIKKHMQEIKKVLSDLCGNDRKTGFYKSGNQDGENIITSWSQYNAFHGNPTWYDFLCITPSGPDFLTSHSDNGKLMGEVGKDTGKIGDDTNTASEKYKKLKTDNEKEKRRLKKAKNRKNRKMRQLSDSSKKSRTSSSSVIDMTIYGTPTSRTGSDMTSSTYQSTQRPDLNNGLNDLVQLWKEEHQDKRNDKQLHLKNQIDAAGHLVNCNDADDSKFGREFLKSIILSKGVN